MHIISTALELMKLSICFYSCVTLSWNLHAVIKKTVCMTCFAVVITVTLGLWLDYRCRFHIFKLSLFVFNIYPVINHWHHHTSELYKWLHNAKATVKTYLICSPLAFIRQQPHYRTFNNKKNLLAVKWRSLRCLSLMLNLSLTLSLAVTVTLTICS